MADTKAEKDQKNAESKDDAKSQSTAEGANAPKEERASDPQEVSDRKAEAAGDVESASIASAEENAELEHSDGGVTTRDDALDVGVPMLQGDASEPVGPEDALGEGPKRGDYRERVGQEHFRSEPNPDAGKPIYGEDGQLLDYEPASRMVAQTPNTEDIGEVAGEKGGVTTA